MDRDRPASSCSWVTTARAGTTHTTFRLHLTCLNGELKIFNGGVAGLPEGSVGVKLVRAIWCNRSGQPGVPRVWAYAVRFGSGAGRSRQRSAVPAWQSCQRDVAALPPGWLPRGSVGSHGDH